MTSSLSLGDFDALSFDCYGTLIDWETGLVDVLGPWATRHGLNLSTDELLESYAHHEAELEAALPACRYAELVAKAIVALGRELDAPVSKAEARTLGLSVGSWPPFADSSASLARLREHYRLIVLSNVDRSSFSASRELLNVEFDAIITAEDVGAYKPSPKNFQVLIEAVSAMGVAREKLLHVAQSLYHDHVPAKNVGLRTAWINRRQGRSGWGATPASQPVDPDWEFPSLSAFADDALSV